MLLTASKSLNVGMHSHVYELLFFKLGMLINSSDFFISPSKFESRP